MENDDPPFQGYERGESMMSNYAITTRQKSCIRGLLKSTGMTLTKPVEEHTGREGHTVIKELLKIQKEQKDGADLIVRKERNDDLI